jgi:chromosome condensin MukBEF MukE localization factor
VAVEVAVAVAGMVVDVSVGVGEKVGVPVTVDSVSKVGTDVRVGVDVSVTMRVISDGEVRASWAAQVAVLPRSISTPTSKRETTSQQRSNGLASMLSPLGCPVTQQCRRLH